MSFKLQRKIYETVEPGLYLATIKEAEEGTGDFGPQIKFTFLLDGTDTELWAWASAKLTNKSKLGEWVTAILGGIPEELDETGLIGKSVNIMVDVAKKEDGTEVNRILKVMRAKQAPRAKPQPLPLVEEEGVEELETGRLG